MKWNHALLRPLNGPIMPRNLMVRKNRCHWFKHNAHPSHRQYTLSCDNLQWFHHDSFHFLSQCSSENKIKIAAKLQRNLATTILTSLAQTMCQYSLPLCVLTDSRSPPLWIIPISLDQSNNCWSHQSDLLTSSLQPQLPSQLWPSLL